MNRKWVLGLSAGLVVFALAAWAAGVAWAQTGGPMHGREGGHMLMHDEMVTAFAEALNMEVATLNERLAAGETMHAIALAEGLTADEFLAVMQAVRAEAMTEALEAGTITQEHANWMLSHTPGSMMGGQGMGRGGMMGGGGMMHGGGMMGGGMMMNDCPLATQQP